MKKNHYLLVCYVNKKTLLENILSILFESGVGGATVFHSYGIGRSQVEDVMMYKGFKDLIQKGTEKDHFTIHCVIPASLKSKIVKKLTVAYGNFKDTSVGIFTISEQLEVYGLPDGDSK